MRKYFAVHTFFGPIQRVLLWNPNEDITIKSRKGINLFISTISVFAPNWEQVFYSSTFFFFFKFSHLFILENWNISAVSNMPQVTFRDCRWNTPYGVINTFLLPCANPHPHHISGNTVLFPLIPLNLSKLPKLGRLKQLVVDLRRVEMYLFSQCRTALYQEILLHVWVCSEAFYSSSQCP